MKRIKPLFASLGLAFVIGAGLTHAAPAQAGWTYLPLQPALTGEYHWARACKTVESGGYGPVWRITFHIYRKQLRPSQGFGMSLFRQNNPAVTVAYNDQWLFGYYGGFYAYASRIPELNDRVQFFANDAFPSNMLLVGDGVYDPATFQTCS